MLARFRADPRKIRIGLRFHGVVWVVSISVRGESRDRVVRVSESARKALVRALTAAAELEVPGIDVGMQWSYDHPQHP